MSSFIGLFTACFLCLVELGTVEMMLPRTMLTYVSASLLCERRTALVKSQNNPCAPAHRSKRPFRRSVAAAKVSKNEKILVKRGKDTLPMNVVFSHDD